MKGIKGVVSSDLGGRVGFSTGKPQPPTHHADRTRNEELALEASGSRQETMALNTSCEEQEEKPNRAERNE